MLRTIAAFLIGVLVAFIVIALVQRLGHMVFPPPADLDTSDARAVAAALDQLPFGGLLCVVAAWALGSFAGAFAAGRLASSPKPWTGLSVGVAVLAATVMTLYSLPHPLWMTAAGVIVPLPAAWLGSRL